MNAKNTTLTALPGGKPVSLIESLGLGPNETSLMQLYEVVGLFEASLPKEPYFRAVIFGSARVKRQNPLYGETRTFAYRIAGHEIDIVTGGGPGLMQAANEGIAQAKRDRNIPVRSHGLHIDLVEGEVPNEYLDKMYRHRNFFTRLHQFARLGSVFVVMPGGIGSLLELVIIWQLLQKEHLKGTPLILVGDMWLPLVDWVKSHMVNAGYASPSDMDLVTTVPSTHEALPLILGANELFKKRLAAG